MSSRRLVRLAVHLDGARLWNASVASGVALRDFAASSDSGQRVLLQGSRARPSALLVGPRELLTPSAALSPHARRLACARRGSSRRARSTPSSTTWRAWARTTTRPGASPKSSARAPGARVDHAHVETNIVNVRVEGADADSAIGGREEARRADRHDCARRAARGDAPATFLSSRPARRGAGSPRPSRVPQLRRTVREIAALDPSGVCAPAACAPTLGRPFMEERAAAERAYSAGRYDEAAEHWLAAEKKADAPARPARGAIPRSGEPQPSGSARRSRASCSKPLASERPKSARAARAAFDAAEIEIEHGDASEGLSKLVAAPSSPTRGRAWRSAALGRLARLRRGTRRPERGARLPRRTRTRAGSQEMAEHGAYRLRRRAGKRPAARRTHCARTCARRGALPLPQGALWDDALWKASQHRGDARARTPSAPSLSSNACSKEQEPSSLQGSYERPRYAPARFRIAEIYRDRLHDPAQARRQFRRVWDEHPTSPLQDDALWNEARLEHDAGRARSRLLDPRAARKGHTRLSLCAVRPGAVRQAAAGERRVSRLRAARSSKRSRRRRGQKLTRTERV